MAQLASRPTWCQCCAHCRPKYHPPPSAPPCTRRPPPTGGGPPGSSQANLVPTWCQCRTLCHVKHHPHPSPHLHPQTSLKLVMDPPAGLQANLVSVLRSLPRSVMCRTVVVRAPPKDSRLNTLTTNTGAGVPLGVWFVGLGILVCGGLCAGARVCVCVLFRS